MYGSVHSSAFKTQKPHTNEGMSESSGLLASIVALTSKVMATPNPRVILDPFFKYQKYLFRFSVEYGS